jgi:hypothetical protein
LGQFEQIELQQLCGLADLREHARVSVNDSFHAKSLSRKEGNLDIHGLN